MSEQVLHSRLDLTGSYSGGRLSLSAAGLVAMIIVLAFPHQQLVEHVTETTTTPSPGGR